MHENDHQGHASQSLLLCSLLPPSAAPRVAALTGLFVPSATAAPDPCAASEVARTVGSVATSTGSYLDSHPETNQALTTISQQQAGPQSLGALKTYFDANPQAGKDMQQLQQPLVSLSGRCKLPITVPQVLGLMQAAQRRAARFRRFAGRARGGTDRRRARRRAARAAGPGVGDDPGHAARCPVRRRPPRGSRVPSPVAPEGAG